jgi:hypothetical protein
VDNRRPHELVTLQWNPPDRERENHVSSECLKHTDTMSNHTPVLYNAHAYRMRPKWHTLLTEAHGQKTLNSTLVQRKRR